MSRAERLLDLLQRLRAHRFPVSGAALARELGVSLRTVYRDIGALQAQGARIDGEPGVGYVLRPAVPLAAVAPAAHQAPPADEPAHRRAARYAWAVLLARIYEVFPLRCPNCGGDMRIIAFITETAVVRDILLVLGEPIAPPTIAPARGPPLWAAMDDAASDAAASDALPADTLAAPAPDFVFDQRIAG